MKTIIAICLLIASGLSLSAPVVIGNPAGVDALSSSEVKKLFLGKLKKLPNGANPVVIEYPDGTPIRTQFHNAMTNKSEAQLQAYWSKLIFTGKGTPPKTVATAAEVIAEVANNPNAIGYLDSSEVTASVKVLFKQ